MFAAAASHRAEAGLLVESFSGAFGPTTTLNGTALGSATTFSFHATFDPTAGNMLTGGVESFAASLSINITGHGTFTSAPGAIDVILVDPNYLPFMGAYGVGLSTPTGNNYFGAAFLSASPPFTVGSAAPSTFSNFAQYVTSLPLTIGLTGGGSLVIKDSDPNTPAAASLTAAVPEPAALIVAAEAALLVGVALRVRRRKA
jgi:hypothetical protein